MSEIHIAYLSIGSNLGNRETNLSRAIDGLTKSGIAVRRISSIFETEPIGYLNQPWFLNVAVKAETILAPRDLLTGCLQIEAGEGRIRSFPGAPRTLDVDILLYGDLILEEPGLEIPHPRMTQRRFVLEPLVQIAAEVMHPALKKTIASLFASCPDTSVVKQYPSRLDWPLEK
jgi:2-amino-4-hydroxy-6-hydroxymethyldihydropteridine diphosphokinase